MTTSTPVDPGLVHSHTTAAPSSVMHWVMQHYGLKLHHCHLIRRGLNDNYALRGLDGARYVARLCSIRPRGEFNIDFETALIEHLAASEVGVATPLRSLADAGHVRLQFPEGARALAVFHHADGAVPETLDEFELTEYTLARIHEASRNYDGPASRYTLDAHHLAGKTLEYLQHYPELQTQSLDLYRQHVHALQEEVSAVESCLTRVICHGDTHGFNNHVFTDAGGAKKAVFFDFDDAGPGYLAYDLGVMPWSYLNRKMLKEPDDVLHDRWKHYLRGYRAAGGEIDKADLEALPLFMQLRHLWNLGEAVGRLNHWGTSMAPIDWLQKQIERVEPWKKIDLRG
ncbi:Ser/Thr protein kinase RdoA (MazF antagonist) [Acidovorax soli]|uniref:Ser/Thr protein kinase RdoA (MazF antagonist) n=1 Tax=Acidovorax soli TaxID=592050 RepID=A0A7X0PC40_9BURK|nr:phosphotransferase [Acidovorax soli]MBB6558832.1 Ser/Thr protein kinase RdoA (MazF antagonist) [Acidovorax soli]